MSPKLVIALVLGLVFQASQFLSAAAAPGACPPTKAVCACCAELDACPCADQGQPEKPAPAPIAPESGQTIKVPAAIVRAVPVAVESGPTTHRTTCPSPCAAAVYVTGYTGVSLAVAFCSFVI